jgi:hypothetical protein
MNDLRRRDATPIEHLPQPAPVDDDTYPAITVWQPWAMLISGGAKPFEFRHWPAPKRLWGRRVAIHAGARPARQSEIRDLLLTLQSSYWRDAALDRDPAIKILERALLAPRSLPHRAVLCLATLGQPIRNNELSAALGVPCVHDSDRGEHTNWGWPLTDIEPLQPFVPATGAQGWWNWKRVAP